MPPTPTPSPATRTDLTAVKTAIHRRLIQKINLDRVTEVRREDVRREVARFSKSWSSANPRR